eukprot:EG_transcript_2566
MLRGNTSPALLPSDFFWGSTLKQATPVPRAGTSERPPTFPNLGGVAGASPAAPLSPPVPPFLVVGAVPIVVAPPQCLQRSMSVPLEGKDIASAERSPKHLPHRPNSAPEQPPRPLQVPRAALAALQLDYRLTAASGPPGRCPPARRAAPAPTAEAGEVPVRRPEPQRPPSSFVPPPLREIGGPSSSWPPLSLPATLVLAGMNPPSAAPPIARCDFALGDRIPATAQPPAPAWRGAPRVLDPATEAEPEAAAALPADPAPSPAQPSQGEGDGPKRSAEDGADLSLADDVAASEDAWLLFSSPPPSLPLEPMLWGSRLLRYMQPPAAPAPLAHHPGSPAPPSDSASPPPAWSPRALAPTCTQLLPSGP